jgi:feruloyl esterase
MIQAMRLLAILALTPVAFAANCEWLASLALPNTTITIAKAIPAGSFTPTGGRGIENLPAFCEVHGVLKPTDVSVIHFEVWIPADSWNGALEVAGNGGLAGTISFAAMAGALRNGYATASTDTGHTTQEARTWLENRERLIDYSHRGLHLATVAAKAIVNAYYVKPAKHSYYIGCSYGGKQGLMEAQRYPADFDGIVAGDAANYWTRQMASEVWNGVVTSTPETNLSQEKLQLIQDAVLSTCDALDGATDGIIGDPVQCRFDPKKLLCKGADGPNCLTAAQVSAVEKLYSGPVNPRTGEKLYPGLYPGGELGWGKAGGQMVINRTTSSGVSSYDFFRYALFHNPDWEFRTFDFDRDLKRAEDSLASITNATDPNLDEFRRLGHKLIYYHGAADPLIPAQNGIDYYETVVAKQKSVEKTQQFYRVFLVPGLYHCSGGPGATAFGGSTPSPTVDADHDMMSAAARWVEKGVAPDKIIATKYVDNRPGNGVALQRPLCVYPLVARYKGSGDRNDANSFACVK